jgi:hypothetical protein
MAQARPGTADVSRWQKVGRSMCHCMTCMQEPCSYVVWCEEHSAPVDGLRLFRHLRSQGQVRGDRGCISLHSRRCEGQLMVLLFGRGNRAAGAAGESLYLPMSMLWGHFPNQSSGMIVQTWKLERRMQFWQLTIHE